MSSSGSRLRHPHREAVARAIHYSGSDVRLYFNYESDYKRDWNSPRLQKRYGHWTVYPDGNGDAGVSVTL